MRNELLGKVIEDDLTEEDEDPPSDHLTDNENESQVPFDSP